MKFCVIGLGRFGEQIAYTLAENGMEVLAIDSNESIIASIRDSVTQAVCMRVTDEASLRSVGVDEMDTVIIAMGENFAQSILMTALVKKKIGVPRVIARGINDIHKDILKLIGADQVIMPEKAIGVRLADSLSSSFTDITRLSKHYAISQIRAPQKFIGKAISDLNIFKKYQSHCIGLKTADENIIPVGRDYIIQEGDRLIFGGLTEELEKIAQL